MMPLIHAVILLEHFGGHKYAAGLRLKLENLTRISKKRFEEIVESTITLDMQVPEVEIDEEIELHQITN